MATSSAGKPNIVVIWGDDIGIANLSCYTRGLMGYQTPNIDRIANEGMIFTDYCGEQSCTAGRASFITGQHGLRTGLTKVGMPAAAAGLSKLDPTIAELLKKADGNDRRRRRRPRRRVHQAAGPGRQALLPLGKLHAYAPPHACEAESRGQSGRWQSEYHDVMIDHDKNVGQVLKALDDAGITDNTFVMYGTDNGPHMNTWPDGAMTPFRSEKNTNWEGAYRVPCLVRWPGKIKPGTVSNQMVAHHDWLPTFLAMAGDAEVKDKLMKGHTIGDITYKVHLDGFNLVPYLTGEVEKSPRESFLYCNDDQQLVALRYDNFKLVFSEQRSPGTLALWAEPFTGLRLPKMFNLRTDPFERADITSNTYWDWLIDHVYLAVPAQAFVGEFLQTFREFPQRQKADSFNLDEVLRKLQESTQS